MLAIIILVIAGMLIGLFYHWGMLAVASFVVVIARVAYHFRGEQVIAVDLLMIAASLCALQGGYIFGSYIAYRRNV